MGLELAQRRDDDRARLTDATEVVAGEVDDHDVLGTVLGARRERHRVGARPFDRTRLGVASAPREEPLRRCRHDGQRRRTGRAAEAEERSVRRRVAPIERAEQAHRVGSLFARQPAREVDLVAVAGTDVLEDRRDALLERGAVETRVPARQRRRNGRACTRARPFDGLRKQVACLAVPVQLGPSRRRVEHQTSREPRQDELGQRRFLLTAVRATTSLDALDRPTELVAQEPRPPSGWQPVEHIQRVGA